MQPGWSGQVRDMEKEILSGNWRALYVVVRAVLIRTDNLPGERREGYARSINPGVTQSYSLTRFAGLKVT
jgi:hypothetical protein